MIGPSTSFYELRNVKSAIVINAGLINGIETDAWMRGQLAPSMIAASSSSAGTPAKNCRSL